MVGPGEVGRFEKEEAFLDGERDFSRAMSEMPDFDEAQLDIDQGEIFDDSYGLNDEEFEESGEGFAKNNAWAFNSSSESLRQFITAEKLAKYDKSQKTRNTLRLNRLGKHFLAKAYRTVVEEYPQLANVRLVDTEIDGNAFFESHAVTKKGEIVPRVCMNFSDIETYMAPREVKEGDNFGLDHVLNMVALRTGARPADIMRNERLLSTFVMMHELGHALDFKVNFLDPARESGLSETEAFVSACKADGLRRLGDMMGKPIPGQVGGDLSETAYAFRHRLGALGIDASNMNEVLEADKVSYREMSSESFADEFATNYIMRHYDDFFEEPDRSRIRGERVRTQIGETLCVSSNMEVLGLRGGRGVKFTLADMIPDEERGGFKMAPVPGEASFGGFLNRAVKVGEKMSINLDGDPINGRVDTSTMVLNGYIRYYKDEEGKVQHETYIQTLDPELSSDEIRQMSAVEFLKKSILYKVELTGEEPREIECSVQEMNNNLNIRVGSKIMLMKQALSPSTADIAMVKLGDFLGGVVTEQPQIGRQIVLEESALEPDFRLGTIDPEFMNGGNTSRIVDAFRKWNSYYVRTENSLYEVIPYK